LFKIGHFRAYNLILTSFLVVIFLFILSYMYHLLLTHSEEYTQGLVTAVEHFESTTENFFDEYTHVSQTLRQVPCIVEMDGQACDPFLSGLNQEHPDTINFAATDADGLFFTSGMPYDHADPPSIAKLPFFKELAGGADRAIMPPHTGPISNEKVTGVVIPILTEYGGFNGVIGVSIRLEALVKDWSRYPLPPHVQLIVADKQGTVIFTSDSYSDFVDGSISEIYSANEIVAGTLNRLTVNNVDYRTYSTSMEMDSGGFLILGLCSPSGIWSNFFNTHTDLVLLTGIMAVLLILVLSLILRDRSFVGKLVNSEEQKHLILNSAFEGIYGIDLDGNCTFCNAAALKILGYEEEQDLIGKPMHDLVHHTTRDGKFYPSEECVVLNALKLGEGINNQDELMWKSDGTSFDSEMWAYPVRKDEKIVGAVVSFIDITEKKRTDAVLQRTTRLATVGQIASGVAHEINNPLATIAACAESLENKLSRINPGSMQDYNYFDEYLKMITQEVKHGSRITSELLNLAKEKPFTPQSINLGRFIRDTIRLFDIQSRFELFSFMTEIEDDIPVLMGDSNRLRQVMVVLVENAIEAMPDGGTVSVSCSTNDMSDQVYIEVSDTGPGIPPDVIDHIFEPFYTTRLEKGTGLGLAVAFNIIARHNGTIVANSTEEGGARLTITLPVIEQTG